jgi:2OG-Fe(II) oxygenase superfamily
MIDDEVTAAKIFNRIKEFIPVEWLGSPVWGLNERLRFLKYHPGEYFKPHNDGIFVRDDNTQCSYVTIHLYLNDVEPGAGGETTFTTEQMSYGRHLHKKGREEKQEEEVKRVSVRPVIGRVLIFEHHLPHEGSTLLNGEKYTVRTDVMYDLCGAKPFRGGRWGLRAHPHPQYKLSK